MRRYVNHTGLMWEHAADVGAMLLFIEHRYYGESVPFAPNTPGCMHWLTSEQAMAGTCLDHESCSLAVLQCAFNGYCILLPDLRSVARLLSQPWCCY